MKKKIIYSIIILSIFCQCSSSAKKNEPIDGTIPVQTGNNEIAQEKFINFGEASKTVDNSGGSLKFISLETNDESIIGRIDQIQFVDDKIYILDSSRAMSLLVFSSSGKYLKRLYALGNGPGEYTSPKSFFIDEKGFVYIYDLQSNRMLKYELETFDFIEPITLPVKRILSFYFDTEQELFYYYCMPDYLPEEYEKQILVADKLGAVKKGYMEIPPPYKFIPSATTNFYEVDGKLSISPFYSNKIYSFSEDSLVVKYTMSFGDLKMVDNEFLQKYKDNDNLFRLVHTSDQKLINSTYTYETSKQLLVRYFTIADNVYKMYIAIWDKDKDTTVNLTYEGMAGMYGLGSMFPYPIGVTPDGSYIGQIQPSRLDKKEISNTELKEILNNTTEEDNPILVLYTLEI